MELAQAANKPTDLLHIGVFGGLTVRTDDADLLTIKNRKACGILAYLALNEGEYESRERLAGLLWSDRSEERARGSLRQCLKQLRDLFMRRHIGCLTIERDLVGLPPSAVAVDLTACAERLARDLVDDELVDGRASPDRVLYGFENLDQSFTAWLGVLRQQWQNNLTEGLQRILRDHEHDKRLRRRAAAALAQADPTHEEAQRFLIRRHADDGNTSAALRQYNDLWQVLGDDYDMEPADETQRLIAEIKAGTYQPAADAPAGPSPPAARPAQPARLPILQINGFRSGGPVNVARYLIDGFRLDLIASLVGFREWVVVDGEQDPQSTDGGHQPGPAKRTAPDYHLEATCFDNAGAIRLIVTLKERATQRYIWSDSYGLDLGNWMATQQAIAQRTAAALDVYLSADRVARRIGGTDSELRAFDLWLRGQSLLKNWDPETERDAERLFRDVVAMMPSFAPAYSSLANIYNSRHIIMPGYFRQRELEHEAADHSALLELGFE